MGGPVWVLPALLLIPHPANASEMGAEDAPSAWVTVTQMGDKSGGSGSWLWPGPDLVVVLWGVNQWVKTSLSPCLSPSLYNWTFQTNKNLNKKVNKSFFLNPCCFILRSFVVVESDILWTVCQLFPIL